MTTNIQQRTQSIRRRVVAGAAMLFVVGVFFVLPLCAAMLLCSMPCCHPEQNGGSVLTTGMMNCATDCVVRPDEAKETTVATLTPASESVQRIAPVTAEVARLAAPAVPPAAIERDAGLMHHAADAPLHVLNSTFRI
jgi:hypothetical protein